MHHTCSLTTDVSPTPLFAGGSYGMCMSRLSMVEHGSLHSQVEMVLSIVLIYHYRGSVGVCHTSFYVTKV